MIAVVKSAGATTVNRALELVVQSSSGVLVDAASATYQIFDTTTVEKETVPVQVFPLSGVEALNMTTSRLGTGRYAATWNSATAALGRHIVRWVVTVAGSPAVTFDQEFEVVPMPYIGPHYCSIYELLATGYEGTITDGTVQRRIVRASRYIEHYTGRQFFPQYKSLRFAGRRGRVLHLAEPIVALDGLNIDYAGLFTGEDRGRDSFVVYNRHISQNLLNPDDRNNPRLEFLHSGYGLGYREDYRPALGNGGHHFSGGVQNVRVNGIFGYTEPDGSMVGATPQLIRWACQRLIMAEVMSEETLASSSGAPAVSPSRIKSVYTRDQGYILFEPTSESMGAPTITHAADPEIESILYGFRRPPGMGAA